MSLSRNNYTVRHAKMARHIKVCSEKFAQQILVMYYKTGWQEIFEVDKLVLGFNIFKVKGIYPLS